MTVHAPTPFLRRALRVELDQAVLTSSAMTTRTEHRALRASASTTWPLAFVLACTPSVPGPEPRPDPERSAEPSTPATTPAALETVPAASEAEDPPADVPPASSPPVVAPPLSKSRTADCAEWSRKREKVRSKRGAVGPDPKHWERDHRFSDVRIVSRGVDQREDVRIVIEGHDLWRHDAFGWREPSAWVIGVELHWRDAWVAAPRRTIAVGFEGSFSGRPSPRPVVAVFDETKWSVLWKGEPQRDAQLNAIHPVGDGYLAVGNDGLVVRETASGWSVEPAGSEADLQALWIDDARGAHVVGSTRPNDAKGGVILHHDGERWSKALEGVVPLEDLWGFDTCHVYAVGGFHDYDPELDEARSHTAILGYDCQKWSELYVEPTGDGETFRRIAGNSPRDIFALRAYLYGDGGEDYSTWSLYHYDGRTWTTHATGGGFHGALSVAPHEVLLSTIEGQYRWGCRVPREPASGR